MNIYQKINEVRKKVEYVMKDKEIRAGGGSFKAVSHDQVTKAARTHFVDQGIIIVPRQIGKGVSIDGMTKSGTAKIRFEAIFEIDFVSTDDGDKLTVAVEAHAEGSDDKCPGKALSYATKSAMLKVLMLETGENDEEGERNSIDMSQAAMIAQLIADTQSDMKKFLEAYQIEKVADLPLAMFSKAVAQLQAKKKKGAQDAAQNHSN